LSRGFYRDFLTDIGRVAPNASAEGNLYDLISSEDIPLGTFVTGKTEDDHPCPSLRPTAAALAANAKAIRPRLCVAEFMRLNGFDENSLDRQPPKDELGGTASFFPGGSYSRLEVYKSIIADPKAAADDKAYALFRAINCYAPSGNNSCGGVEVSVAQRKAWFQRLKKDYPGSAWAKDLSYYW